MDWFLKLIFFSSGGEMEFGERRTHPGYTTANCHTKTGGWWFLKGKRFFFWEVKANGLETGIHVFGGREHAHVGGGAIHFGGGKHLSLSF